MPTRLNKNTKQTHKPCIPMFTAVLKKAYTSHELLSLLDMFFEQKNLKHYPIWLKNKANPIIGIVPAWAVQSSPKHDDTTNITSIENTIITREKTLNFTKKSSVTPFIDILNSYTQNHQSELEQQTLGNHDEPPKFNNGLMGFIGYDMPARLAAKNLTKPNKITFENNQPLAFFGHYDVFFSPKNTIETSENKKTVWQLHFPKTIPQAIDKNQAFSELAHLLNELTDFLNQDKHEETRSVDSSFAISNFKADWQPSDYHQAFKQVQQHLTLGNSYQINLAQRFSGSFQGKPLTSLAMLDETTNAPYAGYVKVHSLNNEDQDLTLISCSPELFLDFLKTDTNTTKVITKPIKGTLPRLKNPEADQQQIQKLKQSEKNTAENVMIVDLLRNDLSVYAKTGTVTVPKLFEIESFAQVHHMVSTITAELDNRYTSIDILMKALPGGSITGAPKVSSMEIIQELEDMARGAYCGSMGFINFDGSGSFNILIRTLQYYGQDISLWAGGGVTVASDCEEEYQECFDKISGIQKVLNTFSIN